MAEFHPSKMNVVGSSPIIRFCPVEPFGGGSADPNPANGREVGASEGSSGEPPVANLVGVNT